MVLCIGSARDEWRCKRHTLRYGQSLQQRSECEVNQIGLVGFGNLDKLIQQPLVYVRRRVSGTFGYHRVERPQVAEKTNCPNADVLVGMMQLCAEKRFVGSANHIQRAQGAKLLHRIGLLFEQRTQLGACRFEIGTARGSLGQLLACLPHVPFVRVKVQLDQIADSQLRKIADGWWFRLAVGDFVDSA